MKWFSKWQSPKIPADWLWIRAHQTKLPQKKTPISYIHFAVLDVETTGLDPKTDRILSIAVVPVIGLSVQTSQHWDGLIQQTQFNTKSMAIHEITPAQSGLAQCTERDMLEILFRRFGHCVWVGHFGSIDYQFIAAAAERLQWSLEHPLLDTAKMLARVDDDYRDPTAIAPKNWQLEAICKHLQLPEPVAHTASGDALATALIFVKLLHRLQRRGALVWGDLQGV